MISINDRVTINDLIFLHGHLVDAGELDKLDQIFSPDVIYVLEDFGLGCKKGCDSIIDSALALGNANPIGHRVTNVLLSEGVDENTVNAKSKYIGIKADGTCGSGTYEDIFKKNDNKWQIVYRKVISRRKALGGKY